jgi:hypothetical protein
MTPRLGWHQHTRNSWSANVTADLSISVGRDARWRRAGRTEPFPWNVEVFGNRWAAKRTFDSLEAAQRAAERIALRFTKKLVRRFKLGGPAIVVGPGATFIYGRHEHQRDEHTRRAWPMDFHSGWSARPCRGGEVIFKKPYDPAKHNRVVIFQHAFVAITVFCCFIAAFVALGVTSNVVILASAVLGCFATTLLLGKTPPQ